MSTNEAWPDGTPVTYPKDYTTFDIATGGLIEPFDESTMHILRCEVCGQEVTRYPAQVEMKQEQPDDPDEATQILSRMVQHLEEMIMTVVRTHYVEHHPDTEL